ncbi:hypothetical protein [Pseudomonas putida]|uniref:hypothetical protein n=1 Tax=Pseudomonas putida TaxID=303 RepID=UPI003D96AFEC
MASTRVSDSVNPQGEGAVSDTPGSAKKKRKTSTGTARQAVILVHGMGEQIPMDTVKGFVSTLWQNTPGSVNEIWSKPDTRTCSLELRRITTRKSEPSSHFQQGVRSDFFELYWADLTAGSTWDQFVGWVRYLLIRPLDKVPPALRQAWYALWVATLFVISMGILGLVPDNIWSSHAPEWLPRALFLAIVAALTALLHKLVAQTFGRVVRYTRADPDNIAARAAVRTRGLNLLRALHEGDEYDRVILVAHSLGSILAYDLLTYFWAEKTNSISILQGTTAFKALREVELAALDLDAFAARGTANVSELNRAQLKYREAQAQLWNCLATLDPQSGRSPAEDRWLISDFVTFGSPLAHAEVLLASGKADLKARFDAREMPISPPVREPLEARTKNIAASSGMTDDNGVVLPKLMSYPSKDDPERWIINHGAPFSVVRWTNVYDPSSRVYQGDLIGGQHAPVFGLGVKDIDLSSFDGRSTRFTHTLYWNAGCSPKRIQAFREAVNLPNAL